MGFSLTLRFPSICASIIKDCLALWSLHLYTPSVMNLEEEFYHWSGQLGIYYKLLQIAVADSPNLRDAVAVLGKGSIFCFLTCVLLFMSPWLISAGLISSNIWSGYITPLAQVREISQTDDHHHLNYHPYHSASEQSHHPMQLTYLILIGFLYPLIVITQHF